MNVVPTKLPGVVVLTPRVFRDDRGFFFESYQEGPYTAAGLPSRFVQDNISFSKKGVLRGLHYQHPTAQGKLVGVIEGEVFDVAVDIRRSSPTFGQWVGEYLSSENRRQMYIPEGYAHGFLVTGASAIFLYKCTAVYDPAGEGSIAWDDPDLAIAWPGSDGRVLSAKDQSAPRLKDLPRHRLPD